MSAIEEKETVSDDHSLNVNVKENEDSEPLLSESIKEKLLEKIRSREGSAPIREEYIDLHRFNQLYGVRKEEGKIQTDNKGDEPPRKKQKVKGQNKVRPRTKWVHPSEKLCHNIALGSNCPFGDKCKFSHNVADYMAKKLPDLGPKCYHFEAFGHCPFGLNCRFGSSHISPDFKNITDESRKVDVTVLTCNNLTSEMKEKLRKRRIKFPKSELFLKSLPPKGRKKGLTVAQITSKSDHKEVVTLSSEVKTEVSSPDNSELATSCQDMSESSSGPGTIPGQVPNRPSGNDSVSETELCSASVVPSSDDVSSDIVSATKGDPSVGSEKQHQVIKEESSLSATVSASHNTSRNYLLQIGISKESQTGISNGSQDNSAVITQGKEKKPFDVKSCAVSSPEQEKMQLDVKSCDLRTPPREKKQLDVKGKLLLAPLTTVGNLPFRRICKQFGADITCGEMAMCTNLLMGQGFEWALLRRHHTEDVFGVQLCGAFPDTMTKCAELVSTHLNVDFIDVNVGCPIDFVYHKGAGSGLMNRMSKFQQIVQGMSSVMDIPLTVKMRMGVQENKNTAHTLIPKLYDWGASVVMVHGRSREARYTKSADWDYLTTCAQAAAPYPFVGNGDILSFEDANEHFSNSQSAGLMIARGALIKPWIFTEIKEQRHWDISASERLDILRDFTNYGLENWGSDTQGVDKTRRFLLEWLSFLHRYIPVGIMERLPQRINERPPYYFGRNDLETLMSSANCNDWVKISEMLLGPVPDDFSFLPKHKANSYK